MSRFRTPLWLRALHLLFLRPFITELRRLNDNLEAVFHAQGYILPSDPPLTDIEIETVTEEQLAIEEMRDEAGGLDLNELIKRVAKTNVGKPRI